MTAKDMMEACFKSDIFIESFRENIYNSCNDDEKDCLSFLKTKAINGIAEQLKSKTKGHNPYYKFISQERWQSELECNYSFFYERAMHIYLEFEEQFMSFYFDKEIENLLLTAFIAFRPSLEEEISVEDFADYFESSMRYAFNAADVDEEKMCKTIKFGDVVIGDFRNFLTCLRGFFDFKKFHRAIEEAIDGYEVTKNFRDIETEFKNTLALFEKKEAV